jgi:hypothetical protein
MTAIFLMKWSFFGLLHTRSAIQMFKYVDFVSALRFPQKWGLFTLNQGSLGMHLAQIPPLMS